MPARVLIGRIQHTARNPVANPRAEAARRRTTMALAPSGHQSRNPQPTTAPMAPVDQRHPRR
jgi:hypothetical protein